MILHYTNSEYMNEKKNHVHRSIIYKRTRAADNIELMCNTELNNFSILNFPFNFLTKRNFHLFPLHYEHNVCILFFDWTYTKWAALLKYILDTVKSYQQIGLHSNIKFFFHKSVTNYLPYGMHRDKVMSIIYTELNN